MATVTSSAAEAIREYGEPAMEALDANVRNVRRAVVAGQHAVEDSADAALIQVRRQPFVAIGLALAVGTAFGGLMAFAAVRCARSR